MATRKSTREQAWNVGGWADTVQETVKLAETMKCTILVGSSVSLGVGQRGMRRMLMTCWDKDPLLLVAAQVTQGSVTSMERDRGKCLFVGVHPGMNEL
jgi:hypothetical protein